MKRPMNLFPPPKPRPIVTPCIGVCTMPSDGLCEWCARTPDEIEPCGGLVNYQRRVLMDDVLQAREAARG